MSTPDTHKRQRMLGVNRHQGYYQDTPYKRRGNFATRLWSSARDAQHRIQSAVGIEQAVYELHRQWLGDLSDKRVLDLGCEAGTHLSLTIAEQSKYYLGIDLSSVGIQELQKKLRERGLAHAEAKAIDFLSPEFTDRDFDVIYAMSVAHHFKYFDVFLKELSDRLKPRGIVITYDPLQTSGIVRKLRALYRPFQSDRDWEWPFTKESFEQIQQYFTIVGVQGDTGHLKWCLPLALFSDTYAIRLAKHLHAKDLREANRLGKGLWSCIHATMCWQKR